MEEKIEVKEATLEDIEDFLEIEKDSFADPWSKDLFTSELSDQVRRIYFKAIIKNNKVGFIGLWFIMDECHIVNIAVHKDYRNKGIAKELVKEAINECKKRHIKGLTLEVREGNLKALNLYESLGFKKAGLRKNYYEKEGEDGIIMWLMMEEEID